MSTTERDLAFTPAVELARSTARAGLAARGDAGGAGAHRRRESPGERVRHAGARRRAAGGAPGHRRAPAGQALPPLFGVPVGIKDVTPTKGIRTTYGSTFFEDHVPDADALVVQRLRAAGAIVLGKTNTPEFAFGPNTVNAVFGATRNPWNLGAHGRWVERRLGGGAGHGHVPARGGHRSRRLAPRAGVLLRRRRVPHDARAHPALSLGARLGLLLGGGADGPHRRGCRADALGDGGPDDRSPISYAVDARDFVRAVKAPSVKGWRIAWTPDLGGLVAVEREVRAVFEHAVGVFRAAGARMEAACPDMSDVPEIVRLTRGFLMVARHGDKLPRHRAVLQAGLVENTEQGLALSAADIAAASSCAPRSGIGCGSSLPSAISGSRRPPRPRHSPSSSRTRRRSTASRWARCSSART